MFEKSAENRRLDVLPLVLGGGEQFAPLRLRELVHLRFGEQTAVEVFYGMLEREGPPVGKVRLAHLLPKVGKTSVEGLVIVDRSAKEGLEWALLRVVREQPSIFRKHAEEDSHQEEAGFL